MGDYIIEHRCTKGPAMIFTWFLFKGVHAKTLTIRSGLENPKKAAVLKREVVGILPCLVWLSTYNVFNPYSNLYSFKAWLVCGCLFVYLSLHKLETKEFLWSSWTRPFSTFLPEILSVFLIGHAGKRGVALKHFFLAFCLGWEAINISL